MRSPAQALPLDWGITHDLRPMTKEERSLDQARAQLEGIEQWHRVSEWASREGEPRELSIEDRKWLLDEMDWAADPDHAAVVEAIKDRVDEDPLEIQVRSDWHSLGDDPESAEFCILLCTGGPAVRIKGTLKDLEPDRCWLEHQDWFTPWTEAVIPDSAEALLWYCSQFYWGEA